MSIGDGPAPTIEERMLWLEKKYETIRIKIPETIHEYYKKNRDRIEKFEKETDLMNSDWTQMDNMLDKVKFNIDANRDQINDNLEALQNHNKELSELKSTKKIDSGIHIILEKRINELKEQMRIVDISLKVDGIDIKLIKKVLRELIEGLGYTGGIGTSHSTRWIQKLNGGEKTVTSERVRTTTEGGIPDSKPPSYIDTYRAKPVEERRANYEARITKDGKKLSEVFKEIQSQPGWLLNAGSARQTDDCKHEWYAVTWGELWRCHKCGIERNWKEKGDLTMFKLVDIYDKILVEKADLEKLFKYLDLGNLYDPTIIKLEEKYLEDDKE